MQCTEEVDSYPSRHAPLRHAERFPIPNRVITGRREKSIIPKQNDFKQPGERYRSWAPDRQERFNRRWVEGQSHPKVSHELRVIWINFLSQCDSSLGHRVANLLNLKPNI
ncbi:catalase-related domain-containing protein [Acinetobacter indicus]|uniref:catalase-related domain-containing protein n=1 Tax=Acinetobacter indicus TaxID=756892 RepID=UPI00338EFDDF